MWHPEFIQTHPAKFIRANSLSKARVQYKTASTLLLLSVYLAKAFLRKHHRKVVQPSSKRLYSAPKMALMLLTEVFFVIPFQLGLMVPLFVDLQSVSQQNIRRSWVVKKRARVLEVLRTGTWRLVCVSSKAVFTSRRMRTKTCCRISLSLTWVTFSCSRQQNWPLQWFTLMQQFTFWNFADVNCFHCSVLPFKS